MFEESMMNSASGKALIAVLAIATMQGCSNMTEQQKATAIGAGVGGVAGSVLTDQSTLGTVGGAAIGGYIGHEIKK